MFTITRSPQFNGQNFFNIVRDGIKYSNQSVKGVKILYARWNIPAEFNPDLVPAVGKNIRVLDNGNIEDIFLSRDPSLPVEIQSIQPAFLPNTFTVFLRENGQESVLNFQTQRQINELVARLSTGAGIQSAVKSAEQEKKISLPLLIGGALIAAVVLGG